MRTCDIVNRDTVNVNDQAALEECARILIRAYANDPEDVDWSDVQAALSEALKGFGLPEMYPEQVNASEESTCAEIKAAYAADLKAGSKRIMATFQPQAWVNDYAVNVDPEGETEWDVTDHILAMGKDKALSLQDDDYETDDIRNLPNAPEWVREWSGPFYVQVADSIAEYFGTDA